VRITLNDFYNGRKKIAATDAIFNQVNQINQAADAAADVLRISIDAKATVKVGPFARGGKSRVAVAAVDHDFAPEATVTPVGLFLPALGELCVYGVTSKVTSDCLVDRLVPWWETVQGRFAHLTTLVINLDNGPENHSRRTQFMQRIVDFVQQAQVNVRLAYYPPYHSKYNPIERCWGILENHCNGSLLDSVDAVLQCARTMTWKGLHPTVELVTTTYQTGVKLTKEAMALVEAQIKRLPHLEKWFVDIVYTPPPIWDP
jgi:transposase